MKRDELDKIIKNVKRYLKFNKDVVAIAGSGLSSIPLVSLICYMTGLTPIYVRRKEEDSHDQYHKALTPYEGSGGGGRYIIIDDLISSGQTIRHIEERVSALEIFDNSRPKNVLLYCEIRESNKEAIYVGSDGLTLKHRGFKPTALKKIKMAMAL
jgi:orotate phosphoribosyltransferase-like protein